MKFPLQEAKKIQTDYASLCESIFELARKVATERGDRKVSSWSERRVDILEDRCIAHFEYYACGESDYYEVEFPFAYFQMTPSEMKTAIEEATVREIEKRNREREDRETHLREEEKRHRKEMYLALKAEFEPEEKS